MSRGAFDREGCCRDVAAKWDEKAVHSVPWAAPCLDCDFEDGGRLCRPV